MYPAALLLTTGLLLSPVCLGRRDDLYDYQVALGESTALWCNESIQYQTAPNDSLPVSWMLPNLTVLYASAGRFQVGNDNWTLNVVNVTHDDLGQYHCMLRYPLGYEFNSTSDWYLARIGLNCQGPYYEDLWAKYELNTIIGISAGFGFLAFAIATMLIWHYRWRDEDEEESVKRNGSMTTGQYTAYDEDGVVKTDTDLEMNSQGHDNPSFDPDQKTTPSGEKPNSSPSSTRGRKPGLEDSTAM